jgi:hypothetical protein
VQPNRSLHPKGVIDRDVPAPVQLLNREPETSTVVSDPPQLEVITPTAELIGDGVPIIWGKSHERIVTHLAVACSTGRGCRHGTGALAVATRSLLRVLDVASRSTHGRAIQRYKAQPHYRSNGDPPAHHSPVSTTEPRLRLPWW